MNRKGQFFSLIAVLLIIYAVVLVGTQTTIMESKQAFQISRAQVQLMDNFAYNFARLDVENILETSARFALTERSKTTPFTSIESAELVRIMQTGRSTGIIYFDPVLGSDAQFDRLLRSLPFSDTADMQFTYELTEITQNDPFEIRLVFLVSYTLSANNQQWTATGVPYEILITVHSLRHPTYGTIIDNTWRPSPGCFVTLLFQSATPCSMNIQPVTP